MRFAKEVSAIILTDQEAAQVMKDNEHRNVRVTPLRDINGDWYITKAVADDAGVKRINPSIPSRAAAIALVEVNDLVDDGKDEVRVEKLDGSTRTTTLNAAIGR